MGQGERFHRTPEVTLRWLAEFPFREKPATYVVVKPLAETDDHEPVALAHSTARWR